MDGRPAAGCVRDDAGQLNPRGRLTQFIAVPPQVEKPAGAAPSPDWAPLFSAAGLDPSKWPPAQPIWTPPVYSDARAAWTGSLAERPDIPMRIEAAAYRGKPVYFELIGPWTRPERMQPYQPTAGERVFLVIFIVLLLSVLVVGAMLARRNLRLGRGDRRGASRLAAFVFAAWAVAWFFGAHHVPNFAEFALFIEFLVLGLVWSCFFWVLYIALEPYVRRRWPATLVSWSRLLAGGFRDPLVGRDVLAGCLLGAFSIALERLGGLFPPGSAILRRNHIRVHSGSFWARARSLLIYRTALVLCASYLACVSVCPVPFPGLAAQGVGGSGRIRSFIYGLLRSGEPVCSR